MQYVRKTKDIYELQIDYGYGDGYEYIIAEDTIREANKRRTEYLKNDTQMKRIRIVHKRVPLNQE